MATLPYVLPGNIRELEWTLASGTALDGYGVDKLVDGDPSDHLWIAETTLAAVADQGSALLLAGLVVIHHNFAEGTEVRAQMHSSNTWGAPDVTVSVDVPAWLGRFAPHLFFDFRSYPEATRTRQWVRLTNVDANDDAVKVGEIIPVIAISGLSRGVRALPSAPQSYGRSLAEGKKGPKYVHDRRTRERRWIGVLGNDAVDRPAFDAWQDASHGTEYFVAWPENDIEREPVMARFISSMYDRALVIAGVLTESPFEIEELSCGEAYT